MRRLSATKAEQATFEQQRPRIRKSVAATDPISDVLIWTTNMRTEQPQHGSPAAIRRRNLIWRLCRDAYERREQGRYAEAEPLYLYALSLAEEVHGSEEIASICNNLAVLYKYMGKFDDAERLYRRALSLTEQLLGQEHTDVASIYHNLGG